MSELDYSLLAPGPVNLHPEVRKILSEPMIHHRIPEFDRILARVFSGLKKVFQTQNQVFIHTSTGSGGMESLLVNTLAPKDKVLVVVSGKFGERWAEMAKVFGADVHVLNVPWGEAVAPSDVESFLQKNPDTKAVLSQATETSTGVAHPVEKLGSLIRPYADCLFLVDGITAVGAYPVPMDAWFIDGLVAGSQKAFMLPTGMCFVSFSNKAWQRIEKVTTPRFYFDIRREKAANSKGETLFSTPVPLIKALDFVLKDLETQGFDYLYKTVHRRAEITRRLAPRLKLALYSKSPSDSVTALSVPSHLDSQKIREELEKKHHITIMGGQDQAKGKILRIGHMGYIQNQEMKRLFEGLGQILLQMDASLFSPSEFQSVLADLSQMQKEAL